jgi:hypothetical protein
MRTTTVSHAASPVAAPASLLRARLPGSGNGESLPEQLRWYLEHLSGYDLSDVRVHRDSAWPARMGARAFVLGTEIHLSPAAEDALEHEAWHVVQQKQGRVRATGTVSFEDPRLGTAGLNDEEPLEREAEAMGRMARRLMMCGSLIRQRETLRTAVITRPVVQKSARAVPGLR